MPFFMLLQSSFQVISGADIILAISQLQNINIPHTLSSNGLPFVAQRRTEQEGFEPPLPVRIKRFSKPSPKNHNNSKNNDLANTQSGAYKPAYKENPKTAQNQTEDNDLELVVNSWLKLPEHIKAAIKTLIEGSLRNEGK